MRIIFYSQHVLGIGHFFRSMEIARALALNEVLFVEGGEPLEGFTPPRHVRRVFLPPVMMDPTFSRVEVHEGAADNLWKQRAEILLHHFHEFKPDRIITELFPFGRRLFRHELIPLLDEAGRERARVKVICSLRDILVEKQDREKFERRVLNILNKYYDLLLVHADPRIIDLAESFERIGDIAVPIVYTGFVCRPAPSIRRSGTSRVIVASTGGGRVGMDLLQATVGAFRRLEQKNLELRVFLGPFMENGDRAALIASTGGDSRIALQEFSSNFLGELAAADLSISMAGYNTCMDILASRVAALVYPFPQNREQAMRAGRLERLGFLRVLTDLSEATMLQSMVAVLEHPPVLGTHGIDLNGAERTARVLSELWPSP